MPRLYQIVLPIALAGALAMAGTGLALAQQERVPADAATTGQKAVFVERLVTSSVSARRIEESGDATATEALTTARGLVDEAKSELQSGQVSAADEKLDRALAMVNAEVQRLSGDEVSADHDRDVYQRKLGSVQAFLNAYQRVSSSNQTAARQADAIGGLIGRAESEAASGQYDAAIGHLDEAYAVARGDIRSMREGQTLTRSLDFETAAEEYEYELGRNESHFLLLQFAETEHQPAGSVAGQIEQHRQQAEALRAEAERQAASDDHATAIGSLNESTDLLLKSIRMSGLFIP